VGSVLASDRHGCTGHHDLGLVRILVGSAHLAEEPKVLLIGGFWLSLVALRFPLWDAEIRPFRCKTSPRRRARAVPRRTTAAGVRGASAARAARPEVRPRSRAGRAHSPRLLVGSHPHPPKSV
jgi:hypothetical protein